MCSRVVPDPRQPDKCFIVIWHKVGIVSAVLGGPANTHTSLRHQPSNSSDLHINAEIPANHSQQRGWV